MSSEPQNGGSYRNLVEPELGGAVIDVSDDFFAAAKRMLSPGEPEYHADRFDEHGKWMDGWESRRKRCAGHDYCVIRICPGTIFGVDIDTAHFTGNFAPAASLEACNAEGDPEESTEWIELLEKTELQGDSHHFLRIGNRDNWTHLRLNIFPDGGIARLRVFGVPQNQKDTGTEPRWRDLASDEYGGTALACNDMHFGDMSNLLKPGKAANMGDGWETRRRRTPGNDWVILKLGRPGIIRRVEVDTDFFKGNNPAHCSLKGFLLPEGAVLPDDSASWAFLLPRVALGPDQLQVFRRQLADIGPVSHVRFDIYPDGGVARLRLLGEPGGET
jgi:allantoicase